ncbi:MerR family transcriptional regulator [Sinirhodobacter huangdaonensis]|uniref:MerR family transcriptional regulator n=1 Tax=Paenirhodobacter huangdaonensis TaxID=2501515 RepID=UPI001EF12EA9|nr:MerR family transcriptional regulator [Sinirhodobacter huangdaonensis]
MSKSAHAFRTISEVAELLETPTHVLRFWESRFPQVKPVKGAGGRRYYRPDDVQLLAGIKKLLHDDGMTIRGVQKLLREQGAKQVAARVELSFDAAEDVPEAALPEADRTEADGTETGGTEAAPALAAEDAAPGPNTPAGTLLTPRVASWRQTSLFEAPAPEGSGIVTEIETVSLVEIEDADDSPPEPEPVPEAPIALDVEPEDPEALAQVVSLLVAGSARPPETAPTLPPTPALAVLSRGLTGLDLAGLGTVERMRLLTACDRLMALQARMGQPPRALPR